MWAHDFIRIIYRASAPAGSGSPEPPQVDQKKTGCRAAVGPAASAGGTHIGPGRHGDPDLPGRHRLGYFPEYLSLCGPADQFLVHLSGWSFIEPLVSADVKLYRFTGGVLHHKVMLADDYRTAIGSANFDNRSFRLTTEKELEARSFPFRLAVQVARLLAPVQ